MSILKNILNKILFKSSKKTLMEAEIFEQPEVIDRLIKKYIEKDGCINIDIPSNVQKIALIASGSSYHSATIAANFLRNYVHCEAQSYYASEFSIVENPDVDSEVLYIFISQSGETADTLKSLLNIKNKTQKTLAITNTKDSSLYNNAAYKLLTHAGLEKAIASTKAMSAQLFCLFLIAAKIMQQKNLCTDQVIYQLRNVSSGIKKAFEYINTVKEYSNKLIHYENAAVLASGMFYPLAKEGALKVKETSYINTTAYPTGEFLHGHIAILNKRCAVIAIINNDNSEFTKNVIEKIQTNYKSDLFIISAVPFNSGCDDMVFVNTHFDIDFIFTTLVIMQLLAFETAYKLNKNVDSPSGLTKVVK